MFMTVSIGILFEALGKWFVYTLGEIFHVSFLGYAHWFMSTRVYQMKDHSIFVDQARYTTSIVSKYLDTATVTTSRKFYKTTLTSDIIFAKDDASSSNEKVDNLNREFSIHYRDCVVSLIYLLSTRVDLSFLVQKLAKFSSNHGKLHFGGLVHLLRYIRENRTLGFKYYSDMKDAPLSELLRQAIIKTENQLVDFSGSSCKDSQTLAGVQKHI